MRAWKASGCLLFDRFAGATPAADAGATTLVRSVIQSVERLLNTRSSLSVSDYVGVSRHTVFHYGLPDLVHYSPFASSDARQIAGLIRASIEAHEPRLKVRDVRVETPRLRRDTVSAVISGQLQTGSNATSPVTFKVQIAATPSPRTALAV
ncbi:type VI secretion system baseplate subunit TssE [Variovorax saccharolyticus]|uniref:type VI secretion system baseplate subunit TssE n=1 Tax=Variovorax saccharolyticus TaxID=3053516 RepID=UPI0025769D58|nr:type VI secretion system baseplate subunit TssE [Variovorax sp. J31P216]MDM0029797.1 type VI secretion system baseplate subunit TssE [Variovorax sp. J31P216]